MKTGFLVFILLLWGFMWNKLENNISYPISSRKGYSHFFCPTSGSVKNGHVPQKLFFAVILENIAFSKKKKTKLNIKYSQPQCLQKILY